MRILITGGCGFIGRHVARDLLEAGHRVRLLDALLDQVHGGTPPDLPEGAEFLKGDLRDPDALARALEGVEGVIHLAAEVGVGQSMYEIARYVGANDLGTALLLQAMADRPIRRLVVASSMSVYGEGLYATADGDTREDVRRRPADVAAGRWDPLDRDRRALVAVPTDERKRPDLASIYALTKFAQERMAMIWGAAYGVETCALRLFNVFGAGQALSNPYTGVLANFAARLANGARPMVFEDGAQRRDFVHVDDVARAFRLALERPEAAGEVFNIGSGRAYPIAEVARLLARAMGRDVQPEILHRARSGDIRNCFADITKARDLLGFDPRFPLEDSLEPFVAWVARHPAPDRGGAMRAELEARGLVT